MASKQLIAEARHVAAMLRDRPSPFILAAQWQLVQDAQWQLVQAAVHHFTKCGGQNADKFLLSLLGNSDAANSKCIMVNEYTCVSS